MNHLNTYIVHSLLVLSQIHGKVVKISTLLSVNVIYLGNDRKLIPVSYHKQKKRKNVLGRKWADL